MNFIKLWILKSIIKDEVKQDWNHDIKITNLYRLIYEACQQEFTEDNKPTLDSFLTDMFNDSLK